MATSEEKQNGKVYGEVAPLNIREKLMMIQTELKAPKNLRNSFGNYNYRNAESILEALKPIEKKYRATTILDDEIIEISGRFYVKATAIIMDIDSDEALCATAYAREDESKKGMDGSQLTGACSSYARKYALNALYLLDDSKDADSDEYHKETSAKANKGNSEPSGASVDAKGHTKEQIKAKYQELISFCQENEYDIKAVCSEYKLNAKSSFEDFDNALRRLIYNKSVNDARAEKPNADISADSLPYEV